MSVIDAGTALAGVRHAIQSMDARALDEFSSWASKHPQQLRAVVDTALERREDFARMLDVTLPAAGVVRGANQLLNRGPLARATNGVLDAVHGTKLLNKVPGRLFGMRPQEALGTASAAMRFGREQRALTDSMLKLGQRDAATVQQLARTLSEYGDDLQGFIQQLRERPELHRAVVQLVDVLGQP